MVGRSNQHEKITCNLSLRSSMSVSTQYRDLFIGVLVRQLLIIDLTTCCELIKIGIEMAEEVGFEQGHFS